MAEVVGRVAELWRFPVKSMQGERIERGSLGPGGFEGDRRHALRAVEDGRLVTAKRHGALLEASARTEADGTIVIALPDGTEVPAVAPEAPDVLSAWLGFAVTVGTAGDDGSVAFEMSFDFEHPDEDLFEWAAPPGTFVDLAGAHLVTTASLAAGRALHPEGDWDVRRFRPTALIGPADEVLGGSTGFTEDAWVDRELQLGEAVLTGFMPTVRCPMPARAQPGLPRDTGVSATLRDHHDNNLGLYCHVTSPGVVAEGDPLLLR